MKKLNSPDLFSRAKFWLIWMRLVSDIQFNHNVYMRDAEATFIHHLQTLMKPTHTDQ